MGWLAYVLGAACLAIICQSLLLRLRMIKNSLAAILMTGSILGGWLMAVLFHSYSAIVAVSGTVLYGFLCELYIFFYTFTLSSVAANLLARLRERPMTRAEIDQLYNAEAMVQNRIRRLCEARMVEETKGRLSATPKGQRLAAKFDSVRRFFGHP